MSWKITDSREVMRCRFLSSRGSGTNGDGLLQTQEKQLASFTKAEVAAHSSQKDCWIVVKGKVYDVSSYVEEHPGGLAILKNAGGDATEGFHGPQHPPRVFDIIDDFLIGDLIE
jgi:cytochrome b involved in lipid metabolism